MRLLTQRAAPRTGGPEDEEDGARALSLALARDLIGAHVGLALGWAVIQLFPGELVQAALLVLGGAVFFGGASRRFKPHAARP